MSKPKSSFKVIIVGGSIAGLTLAHSLDRSGIDYVVLEAHDDFSPAVGASIGILPSGARVLDQLGCWEDIENLCYPLRITEICTKKGELISSSDSASLIRARYSFLITNDTPLQV